MAADSDAAPARSLRRFMPLFVLLAGVGGYFGYQRWLARQPFEWSGTVEARVVHVGSRVGGRVKEVLAKEGDRVVAGQPLIRLESGDFPAQRLVALGTLEQAKANLERLQHGARPEEIEQAKARAAGQSAALAEAAAGPRKEEIDGATDRLASSTATLAKARSDLDRMRKLVDTGAATQADLDTAEAHLKEAQGTHDADQAALDQLHRGTRIEQIAQRAAAASEARAGAKLIEAGTRIEDIKQAEAQVTIAQGHLDQIDVLIAELTITAPRAARIEVLDLKVGDILSPNATAASLVEDGDLYVRIFVPETHLSRIHAGDQVPVTVDSFPGRVFEGVVEHINDVGEYTPRNLQTSDERADQVFGTRIGLKDDGHKELRAGVAAFIHVPTHP